MFWNDPSLEPKRSWRWQAFMFFYYNEVDPKTEKEITKSYTIAPFTIDSFTRPQVGYQLTEVQNKMNGSVDLESNSFKWGRSKITAIDVQNSGVNVSQAIYGYMKKLGYDPFRLASVRSSSKAAGFVGRFSKANKKASITVQQLNPAGTIVEQWQFIKPEIINIDFGGTLNYSSDELVKVTIDFQYAQALYTHGSESKALVQRTPNATGAPTS